MSAPLTLLALGDSPTAETGFARVMQNLLPRWLKANGGPFDKIDVWAINYRGEKHALPFWIYNGGDGYNWMQPQNLAMFLNALSGKNTGGGNAPYTHCWMIQDPFCLSRHKFPDGLRKIADRYKTRVSYYCPADAAMEPEWMEIVTKADAAVAYTHYGRDEILKALPQTFNPGLIGVLPHGCDTKIYRPLPNRMDVRRKMFRMPPAEKPFLNDEDFLLVNVNSHQRRKDVTRSMRILKELKERQKAEGKPQNHPWKFRMMFHMGKLSSDDVDLGIVGRQMGLKEGVDWACSDKFFSGGFAALTQEHVAELYNAADLMLTTTLGEGWGFCLTEAMGCGCPIAAPMHTSCLEIMRQLAEMGCQGNILPLEVDPVGTVNPWDNSRLRQPVDVAKAVETIWNYATVTGPGGVVSAAGRYNRDPLPPAAQEWLSWDRIAKAWEPILLGDGKKPFAPTIL